MPVSSSSNTNWMLKRDGGTDEFMRTHPDVVSRPARYDSEKITPWHSASCVLSRGLPGCTGIFCMVAQAAVSKRICASHMLMNNVWYNSLPYGLTGVSVSSSVCVCVSLWPHALALLSFPPPVCDLIMHSSLQTYPENTLAHRYTHIRKRLKGNWVTGLTSCRH